MRDRLVHRGPDAEGLWSSADRRVCFGFRRLAIVDLSPEANQPFLSHDGRFVIVFNGEIYNFRALRRELEAAGLAFRTCSDTEVLVEAYRFWGAECPQKLSGMFAFAVWDTVEKTLFCARDRAGEKPFYYTQVDGTFLFASELKALLPWPGFRKRIDYPALIDYCTFGYVADPKSIWEGCYKLPPAHCMSLKISNSNEVQVGRPRAYWDLEFRPDETVADWGPRILDTLQESVREMSYADVPIGAFLSGGVDSSSVTAALTKAGCKVKTFTVGFSDEEFDERPWANQVARMYATDHTQREVVAEDVACVFDKLLCHYDEPFNDFSYLPTYYVCREARNVITVALSGDGGDEMFGGYQKYQRVHLRSRLQPLLPGAVGSLVAAGAGTLLPKNSKSRGKLLEYTSDVGAFMLSAFSLAFPVKALRAAARGPLLQALRHYDPQDTVQSHLGKAPPDKVGLLNAMRYLDLKLTLAGDILVKVDRASMAVSLEVRPVYLHRNIMELAAQIPPAQLADRRTSKKVLKSALRAWLPEDLLYRKKQGFAMPLNNWLDGDLQQLFAASGNALTDIVDPALLRSANNSTSQRHCLMFLERWMAKWM